jgi:hypothetical protein
MFKCPNLSPDSSFSNFLNNTVLRLLNAKISLRVFLLLYTYSENTGKVFKRMWRIRQIKVVSGTQNCLRIRGKNVCIHREDAKRHKTSVYISVNNTNLKFL